MAQTSWRQIERCTVIRQQLAACELPRKTTTSLGERHLPAGSEVLDDLAEFVVPPPKAAMPRESRVQEHELYRDVQPTLMKVGDEGGAILRHFVLTEIIVGAETRIQQQGVNAGVPNVAKERLRQEAKVQSAVPRYTEIRRINCLEPTSVYNDVSTGSL